MSQILNLLFDVSLMYVTCYICLNYSEHVTHLSEAHTTIYTDKGGNSPGIKLKEPEPRLNCEHVNCSVISSNAETVLSVKLSDYH